MRGYPVRLCFCDSLFELPAALGCGRVLLKVETLVMVDLDCARPLPGRALPITCFLFLLLFSSFLLIWRLDMAGCLIPARTDAVGHNLFPWGTGRI